MDFVAAAARAASTKSMFPLPILAISMVTYCWIRLFSQQPEGENETLRNIQEHHTRGMPLTGVSEGVDGYEQREREAIRNERKRLLEQEERIVEKEWELERLIQQTRDRIAEEQKTAAAMGFQPIQWPSETEVNAAKKRLRYSPRNLHFAIVGKAGCGKSSLINSFLNLKPTHPNAAPTGTNETTFEIGRYPDPGKQSPRPWTVWYDVPGAGTQRISHWQYFTKQALFVFDIIILAIGERFEETDCQIIRRCLEFKIPYLIVRSKADQSIKNIMSDADEDYKGPFDSGEFYQKCRQLFIESTQKSVSGELARAGLPNRMVYCVSKRALREVYNNSLEASIQLNNVSHEIALVKELMVVAHLRRKRATIGWAQSAISAAIGIAESAIGLGAAGLSTLGLMSSNNVHQKPQSNQQISKTKRVIYLPHPTTVINLLTELNAHNPGIGLLFDERPKMIEPQTALLCFYLNVSIPSNIVVFGTSQEPTIYMEDAPTERAPTMAGNVSASANTPPVRIYTHPGRRFSGAGQWRPSR